MAWARRWAGPALALLAAVVLSTAFGFLYVHSGRSANTDAVYTLLVLLTVITLWAAQDRPWHRVWLGPLLAAVFLLRGMGVLLPLAIVLAVALSRWRQRRHRWEPTLVAAIFFVVPVAAWGLAR
jgi:4-amino-4-deoxy-L-arabinose transferase-like glycosyltransferase